jgi:hypothetical protein
MLQKPSRPRGVKQFTASTEDREYRRVDTLYFQRVFTMFRKVIKTRDSKQSRTVENCVQIMSRVVDWYLKPAKRPSFYGWHDPVKGIRLSRGIVGHLEHDENGNKTWVPDIKEMAELRALQILSCMGLLMRTTESRMQGTGNGRGRWWANVRYLKVHPEIVSIMRGVTLPEKSFDEARTEVELGKALSKANGHRYGEDRYTNKIERMDVGMADAAAVFKLVPEIPTPDSSDECPNLGENGDHGEITMPVLTLVCKFHRDSLLKHFQRSILRPKVASS